MRVPRGIAVLAICLCSAFSAAVRAEEGSEELLGDCPINLCVAVDQGGFTTAQHYEYEKESIKRLAVAIREENDGNQFLSLVGYSDSAHVITGESHEEALEASSTLASSDASSVSGTNVGDAIVKCTENMFTVPSKARRNLPKVIVVLADDPPSSPVSSDVASAYAVLASYAAAAENVTVVTVGVGSGANATLLQLASTSGPSGAPLSFSTPDWDFGDEFLGQLLDAVCGEPVGSDGYPGQLPRPEDLTGAMVAVLSAYSEAQAETDGLMLPYPQVVENIKAAVWLASNASAPSDVTYLDLLYSQEGAPLSEWVSADAEAELSLAQAGSEQQQQQQQQQQQEVEVEEQQQEEKVEEEEEEEEEEVEEALVRQCAAKPTCRMYAENMLCCDGRGILTGSTDSAQLMLLCSEGLARDVPASCLQVDGPPDAAASFSYGKPLGDSRGAALHYSARWQGPYEGVVTAYANSGSDACSLVLADPCEYQGQLYDTAPWVEAVHFGVLPGNSAKDVLALLPEDADLAVLTNSIVWSNPIHAGSCQQQLLSALPKDFTPSQAEGGFTMECNSSPSEPTYLG